MILVKAFFLPPFLLFVLIAAAGLMGIRRHGAFAAGVAAIGAILLVLSMPAAARILLIAATGTAEAGPLPTAADGAGAIVVFAASGLYDRRGPQLDEPAPDTLERVRGAAAIYRSVALPILVSGGPDDAGVHSSLAELMAASLRDDFGVPAKDVIVEGRSPTPDENARFSSAILCPMCIRKVILVTSFWHMARSHAALAQYGMVAIDAPVGRLGAIHREYVPSMRALYLSHAAFYEGLGRLWYRWAIEASPVAPCR